MKIETLVNAAVLGLIMWGCIFVCLWVAIIGAVR